MIKTFKMKLYPGMEEEYERRHNELWPEMVDMIGSVPIVGVAIRSARAAAGRPSRSNHL